MSTRWTIQDLERIAARGVKVEGIAIKTVQKKPKAKQKEAKALQEMKQWLCSFKIPFESEYRFHEFRKFRFDIALLEHKLAFEYEGIISAKSRHTNMKGYTRDADKYNLAQSMNWRVIRYTALNYRNFLSDLKNMEII